MPFQNYGARIDVFAPGSRVPGAAIVDANGQPSDSAITPAPAVAGTSASAAYVSGVAAVYLHDHPSGTASLPKIVKQVIMGNANICTHESIDDHTCTKVNNRHPEKGTADRLLFSSLMPVPANPIDNQRFFVWQHYVDFLGAYPNETGLDFWTRNIAGGNTINGVLVGGCGLNRFDVARLANQHVVSFLGQRTSGVVHYELWPHKWQQFTVREAVLLDISQI